MIIRMWALAAALVASTSWGCEFGSYALFEGVNAGRPVAGKFAPIDPTLPNGELDSETRDKLAQPISRETGLTSLKLTKVTVVRLRGCQPALGWKYLDQQ